MAHPPIFQLNIILMFQYIPIILTAFAGIALLTKICVVLNKKITISRIRSIVKDELLSLQNPFKYKIKEAKKNAVKVGIFTRKNEELKEIEIKSKEGVSKNINKELNTWSYI